MRILLGITVLAAGCAASDVTPTSASADGFETAAVTTAPSPATCERVDVLTVSHLDEVAPGFEVAPSELVEGATGWFEGALEGLPGVVDGRLEVDEALGQVRAIYQSGESCSDYYEIAFMASLSLGDDLLETSFAALLQARSADDVRFGIRVPEAQLEGRLMPDDESFEVAGTDLRVSGNYLGDGDWEGVLEWTFEDQLETVGAFAFSSDY